MTRQLLDPAAIDDAIASIPSRPTAAHLHACTHTTFSCNTIDGRMKTNVIPDAIDIGVDIRTLPGERGDDVEQHLRAALGDLFDVVEVEVLMDDAASMSRVDTPLWDSLQRAIAKPFPTAVATPQFVVGFTDARIFRELGSVAYGAGLLSPSLDAGAFSSRFHGNDERIDVESLRLSTHLFADVARDLLG
jgi:acetylornithine deacetylase/succinyl-diaminopimelate desuccinylase-like protein